MGYLISLGLEYTILFITMSRSSFGSNNKKIEDKSYTDIVPLLSYLILFLHRRESCGNHPKGASYMAPRSRALEISLYRRSCIFIAYGAAGSAGWTPDREIEKRWSWGTRRADSRPRRGPTPPPTTKSESRAFLPPFPRPRVVMSSRGGPERGSCLSLSLLRDTPSRPLSFRRASSRP